MSKGKGKQEAGGTPPATTITVEQMQAVWGQVCQHGWMRQCDIQVVQMLGGTVEAFEDLLTDHWRMPRRAVKRAIKAMRYFIVEHPNRGVLVDGPDVDGKYRFSYNTARTSGVHYAIVEQAYAVSNNIKGSYVLQVVDTPGKLSIRHMDGEPA